MFSNNSSNESKLEDKIIEILDKYYVFKINGNVDIKNKSKENERPFLKEIYDLIDVIIQSKFKEQLLKQKGNPYQISKNEVNIAINKNSLNDHSKTLNVNENENEIKEFDIVGMNSDYSDNSDEESDKNNDNTVDGNNIELFIRPKAKKEVSYFNCETNLNDIMGSSKQNYAINSNQTNNINHVTRRALSEKNIKTPDKFINFTTGKTDIPEFMKPFIPINKVFSIDDKNNGKSFETSKNYSEASEIEEEFHHKHIKVGGNNDAKLSKFHNYSKIIILIFKKIDQQQFRAEYEVDEVPFSFDNGKNDFQVPKKSNKSVLSNEIESKYEELLKKKIQSNDDMVRLATNKLNKEVVKEISKKIKNFNKEETYIDFDLRVLIKTDKKNILNNSNFIKKIFPKIKKKIALSKFKNVKDYKNDKKTKKIKAKQKDINKTENFDYFNMTNLEASIREYIDNNIYDTTQNNIIPDNNLFSSELEDLPKNQIIKIESHNNPIHSNNLNNNIINMTNNNHLTNNITKNEKEFLFNNNIFDQHQHQHQHYNSQKHNHLLNFNITQDNFLISEQNEQNPLESSFNSSSSLNSNENLNFFDKLKLKKEKSKFY